ncbi:nucleoside hydrolase [Herbiconiux flava]|uniref:Pyrimidine-specific ribonucleoside hydrolase n=1 Tax=Herbiconiux flava TaxID=881268 RepID=A0A852SJD4_9MICO|nr:nucleoside hydrolase [Herbiconiux flava]NYD69550.1 pyrimidine-specific ribonucleoside hydrolase [Herbiconiux flava]GLK16295.1 nucleoside hydrolase [Herbiconiux flava]
MAHRVLLDVDTGVDDALAVLFAVAHPEIELIGITCVAGNTSLENVVANTLTVLDIAGAPPIPVSAGAQRPLIAPPRASHVHGSDGLGDLGLPVSERVPDARHAVDLARDLLLASDRPVTIVALAPQTNLALLLRLHPEVAPRIERILFMGGSASGGNATAVAEFNVWHDPEAAAVVLDSGVPTFMYGLDVFNQVTIDEPAARLLLESSSASERLAGALLHFQMADPESDDAHDPSAFGGHIGDAGALCALVDPGALRVERHPVRVELGGESRGQTVVDRRRRVGEDTVHAGGASVAHPVDVALDVDVARFAGLFLETISRLP